jgi:CzcA family heavy metal efflux pump
MNLVRWATRYERAVFLITGLLAAAGGIAVLSLPSDIYPALQFPRIVVIGHAGTVPARSMMLTVTRPLEQAVMEVPGIRRVRSSTFRGATEISAQFAPSTDMVVALQQVQNRIAEARGPLPPELDLTVERLTPAAFPIYSFNLTGGLPTADLRDYGYYVMRPALARVPGVGRVEVLASDTREIEVVVDPMKLASAGLTVPDVAAALAAENRIVPLARFSAEGRQHLVLGSGLWSSVAEVAETPISVHKGATLRLSDVAEVFPGAPDRTTLVTGNGREAALINISPQIGASVLAVKAGIEEVGADLTRALPAGLRLSKVYDLAEFVSMAIANVRDAILIGGFLAVAVLLAFLRDWRVTLVAAVTLPLTVVSTFFFMRLLGQSINLMSMGGLAVAIGLVIDDAVVVVENIARRLAATGSEAEIERATEELFAPVLGSTLTTVVVFVPLGLISGVAGQFFRALSLTLSVAVLISLAQALILIPLLARRAYGVEGRRLRPPSHGRRLEDLYAKTLSRAMGRPRAALFGMAFAALLASGLYLLIPTGFLPKMDEGGFVIDYLTPAGTAIEETDRLIRRVEELVAATHEVASYSRRTGSELGLFATQPNKGDLLVRLKPARARDRSAEDVISDLRLRIKKAVPNLDVEFVELLQDMIGDLEGSPTPIEVRIFGDDPEVLEATAAEVEPLIEKIPGVVDLVGVQRGNPEVTWDIDPVAAGRAGLTIAQVSEQLSANWLGEVATELRLFDRAIPVRVRYPDAERFDPERQARTTLLNADGKRVPLANLAHPSTSDGASVLMRENLRQMAMITARLEGRDLGSAVSELQSRLKDVALPVGYNFEVGGQYQSQRQAFRELLLVFAIAASLVFTILVIQFRAFTPAVLILLAAPLSFGGAFLLLLVTGTELNVSSAMGLILLVGLTVKNGIVLLDYAHRLEAQGSSLGDAVARAARIRLRPILMTTLCTLFGLLPLALGLGAGAELQKPLALSVIGGLALSTLVTLYLVPAVYVALRGR